MPYDFRWGGLSIRKLCSEVLGNFWMVIVSMVITYLAISILARLTAFPLYTSSAVIAVYPYHSLYTVDASTDAMDTASSVSAVFNSAAFQAGLEEQIGKLDKRSFMCTQIRNSNMLMLEVESPSSADAYISVRTAIEFYNDYSDQLPGNVELEVLSQPDVSFVGKVESKLLSYRSLLTLFMGGCAGGLLVLLYLIRKTYKSEWAYRHFYRNIRVYSIPPSTSGNAGFLKKRKERQNALHKEMMRKTAIEIKQLMRNIGARSLLVTSAVPGEGKTAFTLAAARELSALGQRVLILEADMARPSLKSFFSDEILTKVSALDLLKGKGIVREAVLEESENLHLIFSEVKDVDDDFFYTSSDAGRLLEELKKISDIVLIIGDAWKDSPNIKIWKEAADAAATVCRQDKADFQTEDQMIEEVCRGNTFFVGSILEGFV